MWFLDSSVSIPYESRQLGQLLRSEADSFAINDETAMDIKSRQYDCYKDFTVILEPLQILQYMIKVMCRRFEAVRTCFSHRKMPIILIFTILIITYVGKCEYLL